MSVQVTPMRVKNENGDLGSPRVYEASMFNNDGSHMHPVARRCMAEEYHPSETYPSYCQFCIQDNKFYKFTGSGTTTGAWDSAKWTETNAAEVFSSINNTLAVLIKKETYSGTTNTSGSLALNNYASNRIIIGVSLDTQYSYIATIGHSNTVLYIHVTDENGNKIANTQISGTYAYITY